MVMRVKNIIFAAFLCLLLSARAVRAQDDDNAVPEPILPEESGEPPAAAQIPYAGMDALRSAATGGDKKALYYLGRIYLAGGHGVRPDMETGFSLLSQSMKLKYAPARAYLGRMNYYGFGILQDHEQGLRFLRAAAKAGAVGAKFDLAKIAAASSDAAVAEKGRARLLKLAAAGNAEAQEELGSYYLSGENHYPMDYTLALKFLRDAVKSGSESARYKVATMYLAGKGVERNPDTAMELFTIAAHNGFTAAREGKGDAYCAKQEYGLAVSSYKEAVADGYVSALDKIGRLYASGKGVEKSTTTAAEYFKKAGAHGYPSAYADLGKMCLAQSVSVGADDAVSWLEKSVAAGFPGAGITLGLMYASGKGVPVNEEKAYQWFLKAAQAGIRGGQEEAADRLLEGRGVAKDETAALGFYEQAAQSGSGYSLRKLAQYYYDKAPQRAFDYAAKASSSGDAEGMRLLGKMYEDGKGVAADFKKAYKWLTLAQWRGARAQEDVFALEKVMAPDDIAQAKRDALWQRDSGASAP